MSIVFLWLLFISLTILLIKLISPPKNYIICFLITILIVLFFINLKTSMNSAIDGCKLWFTAIFPTVFPFLVICNLLISYDGIDLYSKFLGPIFCKPLGLSRKSSFPITASMLCGYPLGAKYASDTYNLGHIDKSEHIRLVNIATNCSPLFILGPVATVMLGNVMYGYLLLIANYLSPIIIALIIKRNNKYIKYETIAQSKAQNTNFGQAFKDSISNAITTTLSIGGFIVIFSVIIGIIKTNSNITLFFNNMELFLNLPKDSLYALFLGSIEITNGCNIIATSALSIPIKLSIISFLCSFSGFCIIAQASSFISKDNISILKYSILKLLQGIISFFITLILSMFCIKTINASSITINNDLSFNIIAILMPIIILLIITIIFRILKNLFFHIS